MADRPEPVELREDIDEAGDRAAGRREFATQRIDELRARSADLASSSGSAVDAASALASARRRADAAERSAVIAHESAARAHERAADVHEVVAQGLAGAERERHEARAVSLRAHADRERQAVTPSEPTPDD